MVIKYLVGTSAGVWMSSDMVNWVRWSQDSLNNIGNSYFTRSFSKRTIVHTQADKMYSCSEPVSEQDLLWDAGLPSNYDLATLIRDGVHANNICVLAAHGKAIYVSNNLKDFVLAMSGTGSYYTCCYHNGQFVVAGSLSNFATSADGTAWSESVVAPFANITCMCSAFGRIFVAGTVGKIQSAETINGPWTTHDFGPPVLNVCMTYENGVLVIGCDNGTLKYTTDGVNWNYYGIGQTVIRRITYSGGKWYSVDDNGNIGISTNFPDFVNTSIRFNGGWYEIHDIVVYNGAQINGIFSGSGVRAFMSIKSLGITLEVAISSQTTTSLTIDPTFIETWGKQSGPVQIMVVDCEYISDWIDWEFK